jgi:hypothetical protein
MWRKEDFLFVLETEIEEKPELKNILYQCFNDQAEIFFLFPLYKEIDEKALGNLLKSKSTDLINHLFQFDSNSKNLFRDLWDLKNYKPEYEPEIIKFLENYFFFGRMKGVDINNNIFKNELDISTHRLQKLKKDQPQEYQQAIKKIKEDPKYPDSLIEFAILNHPNL